MITLENFTHVLIRFSNENYDKTKQEITLKLKEICASSSELNRFIKDSKYHRASEKSIFLAGLIIGVILEKEYKL